MSKKFIRKTKESKPVVAICYDFDKTLSPDDMQAQDVYKRQANICQKVCE